MFVWWVSVSNDIFKLNKNHIDFSYNRSVYRMNLNVSHNKTVGIYQSKMYLTTYIN